MNFKDFLTKAKMVLKEDAGSEGMSYKVKFKGELKGADFVIDEQKDGEAIISFPVPKDYGFALQHLKDSGVEVIKLELLY